MAKRKQKSDSPFPEMDSLLTSDCSAEFKHVGFIKQAGISDHIWNLEELLESE